MRSASRRSSTLTLAALGVLAAVALLVPAAAQAYTKPRGGAWKVRHLFDRTTEASFVLTRSGSRLARLTFTTGEGVNTGCAGQRVSVTSHPRVAQRSRINGRWSIGRLPGTLLKPVAVGLKVDGQAQRGSLLVSWDEDRSGDVTVRYGTSCWVNFYIL